MRGKNLLWTSLLAVLVLATINIAMAPPSTKMEVDPGNFGNVSAGTHLTADIVVSNTQGVSGWEFKLMWNPFVLKLVDISQGPFLSQGGMYATVFASFPSPFGDYVLAAEVHMSPTTTSGDGVLATVEFMAIGAGSTSIDLVGTKLLDINVIEMDHNVFGGKAAVHIGVEAEMVWADEHLWIISDEGPQPGINNLYVELRNHGTVDADAYVMLKGFAMDGSLIRLRTNTATVPAGGSVIVQNSGFNATDLGAGVYRLTAYCYWMLDGQEFNGFKHKHTRIEVRP